MDNSALSRSNAAPNLAHFNTSNILTELHSRLNAAEKAAHELETLQVKVAKLESQEESAIRLLQSFSSRHQLTHSTTDLLSLLSSVLQGIPAPIAAGIPVVSAVAEGLLPTPTTVKATQPEPISAVKRLHFTMFLGSVRANRNADRVKNYLLRTLENLNIAVTVFDPLDFNYTQLIQPLHYYPNQQEAPPELLRLNEIVKKADGHIIVTPEYHASMGPSLATLIGQFAPLSFAYRPAAIVSYSKGRYGGIRAAMQLRTYLSELGLIHVPSMLAISHVENITEQGQTENPEILTPTAKLMEELIWFAEAVKEHSKEHELLYRGKLWSDHGPSRAAKK